MFLVRLRSRWALIVVGYTESGSEPLVDSDAQEIDEASRGVHRNLF